MRIVFLIVTMLSFAASAQTPTPPPDIPLPPVAETGQYQMRVSIPTQDMNDNLVHEACCQRVDVDPVLDLGCDPRDGTEQVIEFMVDVIKTPGDDAEIRCYTVNVEDSSDLSLNSYILIFPLRPNAPSLE
jgi:hypothetical protein